MTNQLRKFFKEKHIRPAEIAQATGYSYGYVIELLNNTTPLTPSSRFRFIEAFPEILPLLLGVPVPTEASGEPPAILQS